MTRETEHDAPRPRRPSTWPAIRDSNIASRVDLRLGLVDDDDVDSSISEDEARQPRKAPAAETGPVATASTKSTPVSDGLKLGGVGASVLALSALIDKLLSDTGLTATDLVQHLGPALGVLYMASPVVFTVALVGWLVLRGYKREQDAHRRRDRRLQRAIVGLVRDIKEEFTGFRNDVAAHIDEAVSTAAQVARARADQTDMTIAELRQLYTAVVSRVTRLETIDARVARIESMMPNDAPTTPRRARVPNRGDQ